MDRWPARRVRRRVTAKQKPPDGCRADAKQKSTRSQARVTGALIEITFAGRYEMAGHQELIANPREIRNRPPIGKVAVRHNPVRLHEPVSHEVDYSRRAVGRDARQDLAQQSRSRARPRRLVC